MILLFSQSTG